MKRHWTLLLAVIILLLSGAAAWWSRQRVSVVAVEREKLEVALSESESRMDNATRERKEYELLDELATTIRKEIHWEPDCTYILRWLGDTASASGVRLSNSRVVTLGRDKNAVASGTLRRTQLSLRMEGTYARLVDYVERVERSPHLLLIEKLSMAANRGGGDEGEMRLTVSSLYPVALEPAGGRTVGERQ